MKDSCPKGRLSWTPLFSSSPMSKPIRHDPLVVPSHPTVPIDGNYSVASVTEFPEKASALLYNCFLYFCT